MSCRYFAPFFKPNFTMFRISPSSLPLLPPGQSRSVPFHQHVCALLVRWSFQVLIMVAMITALRTTQCKAQQARIFEEVQTIKTYPYYEPNPVPILTRDPRLHPYHEFQSYALDGEDRDWTVVTLENEYVVVYVLPEVGGKVWGAIEKASGHEFIYRNEVLKFRDISLRGPWTSGGIEFNFGVIGHTPSTATPVDYLLQDNPDGSVSCFVGAMDLPSRTTWRVEIRLPADKAYFETNVLWTNPTPLVQPYYNWMTAAAFARDDLDVTFPGDTYLQHSGQPMPWPFDEEGRELSSYAANAFGPSKSYHVVGEFNDFFGGYYRDDSYGFGHWAPYSQMPGKKLWIWSLSRSGGIWEDLLTDTDGQYVEFQAGRLFVQYSAGSAVNPITQAGFEPYSTDRWTEFWFPVEGIGGLSAASSQGAMHVEETDDGLTVAINAFGASTGSIKLEQGGEIVWDRPFDARPLDPVRVTGPFDKEISYEVIVPALDLRYASDATALRLDRPFETDPAATASVSDVDALVLEGNELYKARRYADADARYTEALRENPWHRGALEGAMEISYRRADYETGRDLGRRLLQQDAYDARANFLAGIHYRALEAYPDAKDAFGWAARSMAYRSAAFVQLSEIALLEGEFKRATSYAEEALDYDRYSLSALQVLATVARATDRWPLWTESIERILEIDPLSALVPLERYVKEPTSSHLEAVRMVSRGEFPEQPLLETALSYVARGRQDDARLVLETAAQIAPSRVGALWLAFLVHDSDETEAHRILEHAAGLGGALPYRPETIQVLKWALANSDQWQWSYLLALTYWSLDRTDEAAALVARLGDVPDEAAFYVARADLLRKVENRDEEDDLRRAVELDPFEPAVQRALIQYLQAQERWSDALQASNRVLKDYDGPSNFDVLHARSLLNLRRPVEAIEQLDDSRVLPSEGSAGGHIVYEQAHLMAGLAAYGAGSFATAAEHFRKGMEWPENLGAGRPYDPDDRLLEFLQGMALEKLGDRSAARDHLLRVIDATRRHIETGQLEHFLPILAFRVLNDTSGAADWIRQLEESRHADEARTRWVFARAVGRTAESQNIEIRNPELFDSLGIRLLLESIDTVDER